MTYGTLSIEQSDAVCVITLDNPEQHNPLSIDAARELTDALIRADGDDGTRAVVLTGAGDSFSAGGDIEEFTDQLDNPATTVYEDGAATAELFALLTTYETPLITAVNGGAFGGGCGLVAASHVAYADPDARLGTTEISLGLFPMVILPAMRRAVGDRTTMELALTGRRLDAQKASEIGLVTEVVTDGDALDRALETARAIAEYSPFATSLGLNAFHHTSSLEPEVAIPVLNAYRVLFYKSHDLNEGASAFLEGREPEWKGR